MLFNENGLSIRGRSGSDKIVYLRELVVFHLPTGYLFFVTVDDQFQNSRVIKPQIHNKNVDLPAPEGLNAAEIPINQISL